MSYYGCIETVVVVDGIGCGSASGEGKNGSGSIAGHPGAISSDGDVVAAEVCKISEHSGAGNPGTADPRYTTTIFREPHKRHLDYRGHLRDAQHSIGFVGAP